MRWYRMAAVSQGFCIPMATLSHPFLQATRKRIQFIEQLVMDREAGELCPDGRLSRE